jgi:nucleoside-diphosphate-sugar epimerase
MDKAHVITDFIKKGFETGDISMLTDGTEQREFLYAEDCCEALESVMENYDKLDSEDNLHITSFEATSILRIGHIIQGLFAEVGRSVTVTPAESKDEVQKDKRNEADRFITQYWNPKTTIQDGIRNVFNDMKGEFL